MVFFVEILMVLSMVLSVNSGSSIIEDLVVVGQRI
jgi:hypothetical protein